LHLLLAAILSIWIVQIQSANDGFNPGANNVIHTLMVQVDGKILLESPD
jgi:hypothetical protein